MSGLAVVVAICAAVSFGWSTALMHHGASGVAPGTRRVDLMRHVMGQKLWLLGVFMALFGLALHTAALHLGSLTLVQPLIVTGLFFSLVFREALDRRWPSRRTVTWGAITAAGLGLFLTAAGPTGSTDNPDDGRAALVIGVGLACSVLAYLLSRGRTSGLLLGTSGGVVFGLMAGAVKSTTDAWTRDELFTTWPVYAMVGIGLTGFWLNQRIYNETRLADSLPMLNLVNPVVSLVFGVVVYSERPSGTALALVLEALGLAAVLLGIFFLGRTEGAHEDEAPEPQAEVELAQS
ncbi:hypothetical protein GCM10027446_11680 [Angustibacter peucedani]